MKTRSHLMFLRRQQGVRSMDEHKRHKKMKMEDLVLWAGILLGIVLLVTNAMALGLSSDLKKATAEYNEKMRPGKVSLLAIKNSRCTDCSDIQPIVDAIKQSKVNITNENTVEFNSKEAKDIISKYKLKKVPVVVMTGEIDRVSIDGLVKQDDALIYSDIAPPYTNAGTGRTEGAAKLYLIVDSSCTDCSGLDTFVTQVKSTGIKFTEEKTLESSSAEGAAILSKYRIEAVPALVISKEADLYASLKQAWSQVGTIESDGSYVLRTLYPPFKNMTTGQVRGVVKLTYLTDSSCAGCYDATQHKAVLSGSFGIGISSEETVDVSSAKGKGLVSKHAISLVPTIILSSDISAYPSAQGLKQFFKATEDGSYVFTSLSLMGTYKDLSTGEVVVQAAE
jgi:thiol-disulfide isomerase/thioredoxin